MNKILEEEKKREIFFFTKISDRNDFIFGWYLFIVESIVDLNIILNEITQDQNNKCQLLLVIWRAWLSIICFLNLKYM